VALRSFVPSPPDLPETLLASRLLHVLPVVANRALVRTRYGSLHAAGGVLPASCHALIVVRSVTRQAWMAYVFCLAASSEKQVSVLNPHVRPLLVAAFTASQQACVMVQTLQSTVVAPVPADPPLPAGAPPVPDGAPPVPVGLG
jgi:hypothetical protein